MSDQERRVIRFVFISLVFIAGAWFSVMWYEDTLYEDTHFVLRIKPDTTIGAEHWVFSLKGSAFTPLTSVYWGWEREMNYVYTEEFSTNHPFKCRAKLEYFKKIIVDDDSWYWELFYVEERSFSFTPVRK